MAGLATELLGSAFPLCVGDRDTPYMQTFVTVLVPILTLILGAVASYLVSTRQGDRDLRTRQRIEYLLSAYRTIEGATNRARLSDAERRDLERAVADVNLLGSLQQQQAIQRAQETMAATNSGNFNEVLELLRRDLRRYLGIERGLSDVRFFRMEAGWGPGSGDR